MPPKKARRKKGSGCSCGAGPVRGPHHMRGCGFFSNVGNWIKGAANTVGRAVVGAVKNVKPSQVLGLIPHPGASTGLKLIGLGKKRKGGARGKKAGGPHAIAHRGKTKAGMIVQPSGTGFYTMPLSLNGGVMRGGGKGMIR
jgi:hypothetical protein